MTQPPSLQEKLERLSQSLQNDQTDLSNQTDPSDHIDFFKYKTNIRLIICKHETINLMTSQERNRYF